jgi:hypothetical protein
VDAAVSLVESYLRLNGYFTATEFQVQQPAAGQPGRFETATDLDILGVHLPWAAETVHRRRSGKEPGEIILAHDPALRLLPDLPDLLIGEVKEGASQLNRALKTPDVLHVALRRSGCCPEEHIADVVGFLLRDGEAMLRPPHAVACRVRLASFCGYVDEAGAPEVLTITLGHMLRFMEERLTAYREVLRSAHFRDPSLGMLKLMEKLGIGLVFKT